jgi:hypothetical protein
MTSSTTGSVSQRFSWVAVPWPVFLIAGVMVVGLMALSGAYGFHGDEMYYQSTCGFRSRWRMPGWRWSARSQLP